MTRTRGIAAIALCMLAVVAAAISLISHYTTVLDRGIAMDFNAVEIRGAPASKFLERWLLKHSGKPCQHFDRT